MTHMYYVLFLICLGAPLNSLKSPSGSQLRTTDVHRVLHNNCTNGGIQIETRPMLLVIKKAWRMLFVLKHKTELYFLVVNLVDKL